MATDASEMAQASYAFLQALDRPALIFDPKTCIEQAARRFQSVYPSRSREERIEARLVIEALNLLSPLQRAALVLTRRDGLTCDDIARLIGISPDDVRRAFASGMLIFVRHVAQRTDHAETAPTSS